MKILLSWLHEMLPVAPPAEEVKNALLSVGIEVVSARHLAAGLEDVVVGKILSQGKHPDADRLTLCRVTDGAKEYSIVCGAHNMKAGDCVALAYIGAKLPNGVALKKTKIRGVESEGMLCSGAELRFSEESEGILILSEGAPVGERLADFLGRNDWLLELELTPNRGDCLGVIGVAREAAAALGVSPKVPMIGAEGPKEGTLQAFVDDSAGAPRYVLRSLDELKSGASPTWLASRLELCGVRSINNLVDVTNYVMIEWGQPMHAFDKDKVAGRVRVRRARDGERILCLDDVERTLTPVDLVIADDQGPIAVAGVMGGTRTAVSAGTKAILLESACFDPKSVRATSRRMNLHTESSHRFERGVDPAATWSAADRAVELFAKIAGAREVASVDLRSQADSPRKLTLRRTTLERILGEDVKEAGTYLSRLGLSIEKLEAGWRVEVPPRRADLEREIDLVEEVARLHGYGKVGELIPPVSGEPEENRVYDGIERVRSILSGAGLQEARTYSFSSLSDLKLFSGRTAPEALSIVNPIASGTEVLRGSVISSLLQVWKSNQARQREGVRIYEIGTVFAKAPAGSATPAREETHLACCLAGVVEAKTWDRGERKADFYDAKGVVEFLFAQLQFGGLALEADAGVPWLHPGKSARIVWRKKELGVLGELHPRVLRELGLKGPVVAAELHLEPVLGAAEGPVRYKAFSAFPTVTRDLAFLVNKDVSAERFFGEVRKLREPLLRETELFDHWGGKGLPEGQVSLAFRLTFGADRTLTDEEVDAAVRKIVAHIQLTCSAQLRGELS